MNIEQLKQEEKDLEEKLFGTPEEDTTKDSEAPIAEPENQDAPTEDVAVTTDTDKPSEDTKGKQERGEDWKLRYTNLRNSRDTKLYEAQAALAESRKVVSTLQQKISELKASIPEAQEDIFKDAFTEDEREALGPTAIAAMQKTASMAAEARTAKIQKELKEARDRANAEAAKMAAHATKEAYGTFLSRLSNAVPEYQLIDSDPRFKSFMDSIDLDGNSRLANFLSAEKRGDVATVARHMLEFKMSLNPKAQAKASLDSKINPTGEATKSNRGNKDTADLTMSEINEHYRKHARGGYKGRQSEFLAMEARIDAAALAGKIKG
jgi:glycine cleavage system H lipoate-binding protein